MLRNRKLVFSLDSLSEEGLAFLRQGWCVDEDPNHLQVDEVGLLDSYCEDLPDDADIPDKLPEEVWTKLGLCAEDRAEIEALWLLNPENEVEFEL